MVILVTFTKNKREMTSFSYLFEEKSRSKVNLKNVWTSATMTFILTYSFILIFCLMLIIVSSNHTVIFKELIWSRAVITSAVAQHKVNDMMARRAASFRITPRHTRSTNILQFTGKTHPTSLH